MHMYSALNLIPRTVLTKQTGGVAQIDIWEEEAGGSVIQDQLGLHKTLFKKKKKQTNKNPAK